MTPDVRNVRRARLVEAPGADHSVFATRLGPINLPPGHFLVPSNNEAEVE